MMKQVGILFYALHVRCFARRRFSSDAGVCMTMAVDCRYCDYYQISPGRHLLLAERCVLITFPCKLVCCKTDYVPTPRLQRLTDCGTMYACYQEQPRSIDLMLDRRRHLVYSMLLFKPLVPLSQGPCWDRNRTCLSARSLKRCTSALLGQARSLHR